MPDGLIPDRLVLVHWKPAEVRDRIAGLEDLGFEVDVYSNQMGSGLGKYRDDLPCVVLISLERLPSHGRQIGSWFRTTKATAGVPFVFVGGKSDKVEAVRAVFADAVFTEWDDVEAAIRRARRRKQKAGPTTECSTKELWDKLEIREDYTVALLGAPAGFERTLGKVPSSVTMRKQARGQADLVVLFPKSVGDLAKRWPSAVRMLPDKRRIWVAWPKRASGVDSNVTQDLVRGFGIDQGWTDVKICRIDDVWSAHMFARKRRR